jgi:hypothetical protein
VCYLDSEFKPLWTYKIKFILKLHHWKFNNKNKKSWNVI